MDPKSIIEAFNNYQNSRDHETLATIISDSLVFIDSTNHTIMGKQACLAAWRGFCKLFQDYQSIFQEILVNGNTISVRGHSTCSYGRLQGPALWSAKIKDGKVDEWRVYKDTTENRALLGLS